MTNPEYGNPRLDPDAAGDYRKDDQEEAFLARLNEALESLDGPLRERPASVYPTLFVLGLPRSGTTLFSQLLATYAELGYVTNLSACFWRAPLVGTLLGRKLATEPFVSSFKSTFGRTRGAQEPHEFGYFWSFQLGYTDLVEPTPAQRQSIDWADLAETVQCMSAIAGAPFFFKNVLLNWHIADLYAQFPAACFVWLKRDRVAVAHSLAKMREEFLGSRDLWASAKPKDFAEFCDRPYREQIAYQICRLEDCIGGQLDSVPSDRYIELDFEDLLGAPIQTLDEVVTMVATRGVEIAIHPERLVGFKARAERRRLAGEVAEIRAAFERVAKDTAVSLA